MSLRMTLCELREPAASVDSNLMINGRWAGALALTRADMSSSRVVSETGRRRASVQQLWSAWQ